MRKSVALISGLVLALVGISNLHCSRNTAQQTPATYLNHSDSVKYVGIQTCRGCHNEIYNSFIQTGMGQSFAPATHEKSAADFSKHHVVYDKHLDFWYHPFWRNNNMYIMEFRLQGKDTIYKRLEKVDYIVGSGQHTNSHLMSINGYVYQLPLTWYAQKKKWDLPPGFENGKNMRFSREIGLECMSCHNAMPTFENNSQNLFTQIPNGIDCERCHGPGALHVKEKTAGNWVDTATQIDYTIVNPKKLSWELQTDICQRCHLQGNAVLKEGKSFTDFRPGMKLSDFIEVYMPKYKDRDDEFIMASHAQRLQMSKCYIQSANGQASAQNKLTCISCHNPHVSVKVTGKQVFNQACAQCHDIKTACKETTIKRNSASDNCVGCHMPLSGTIDIPHVTVHDHYIRKSAPQKVKSAVKDFAGIYCVNNPRSASDAKAKAYLAYAEKFEGERISVDSGVWYTNQAGTSAPAVFDMRVHYLSLAKKESEMMQLASAVKPSSVNEPWTCYRIGQAYQNNNEWIRAEFWYRRALTLAPQNLSFMNKLGEVLIQQQKLEEGMEVLNQSLRKNHKQADALTNLGFACVASGDIQKGLRCYDEALALSPDNEQALLNKAAVLNAKGQKAEARKLLQCIIVLNPGNTAVKQLLKNL